MWFRYDDCYGDCFTSEGGCKLFLIARVPKQNIPYRRAAFKFLLAKTGSFEMFEFKFGLAMYSTLGATEVRL